MVGNVAVGGVSEVNRIIASPDSDATGAVKAGQLLAAVLGRESRDGVEDSAPWEDGEECRPAVGSDRVMDLADVVIHQVVQVHLVVAAASRHVARDGYRAEDPGLTTATLMVAILSSSRRMRGLAAATRLPEMCHFFPSPL